jgi:hypothetical protein
MKVVTMTMTTTVVTPCLPGMLTSEAVLVIRLVLDLRCRLLRRPNCTLKVSAFSVKRKGTLLRIVPIDKRRDKSRAAPSREKSQLTVDSRVEWWAKQIKIIYPYILNNTHKEKSEKEYSGNSESTRARD